MTRSRASFWLILGAGAALFLLYPYAAVTLVRGGGRTPAPALSAVRMPDGWITVTDVDPSGPAAGRLRPGDRILTTNGIPTLPPGLGWVILMDLAQGDPYTLRVLRGSVEHEYTLTAAPVADDTKKFWLLQLPLLLISFCFYVSGVAVGLLRPHDRVARLYTAVALLVAASLIPLGVFFDAPLARPGRHVLAAAGVGAPFVLPVTYHFFCAFPPGVRKGAVWSHLTWVLYGWAALLFPVATLTGVVTSWDATRASGFIAAHAPMFALQDRLYTPFIPIALVAIIAVIVRNHFAVADASQRRRFRWVFWGSIASAAPFTAVFIAGSVFDLVHVPMDRIAWLRARSAAELFLGFLPATFAYAVVHHRVIGVEVVVRRGVRYLLAKNVLRAVVFLPIALIVLRVVPGGPLYYGLAALGAAGLYARERLHGWIDRRFFREACDREHLLVTLADEIAGYPAAGDLARLVSRRIDAALHTQTATLLFVGEGLHPNSAMVRVLEQRERAQDLPFRPGTLPADEMTWLETLGVRLAVPIGGGRRRLTGVLLLGEKKSEEPYSREDRTLLEAVAGQLALVRENDELRRGAVEAARIRYNVLAPLDARGVNLLKECPACGRCYDRADDTCAHDGAGLTLSLPIDRTIDGKYRLDRLLGRGGMGAVYEASDLGLDRSVAVKLMTGGVFADEDARRRFDREARAAARLRHRNIVAVYDYGNSGHHVAYLVMERLIGRTLRAELQRTGGVAPAIAAGWFDQILAGVAAAHAAGVIHRDLKPENIFLALDDHGITTIKVLDFGVAQLQRGETVEVLTESGTVIGTLAYMSPEQLSGAHVDERSDLFAVGVMMIEVLTGHHPFRSADAAQTVAAILHEPARLNGDGADVSALNTALQHCLAKDRFKRFPGAAAMRSELIPLLRRCTGIRHTRGADPNASTSAGTYPSTT